MLESLHINFLSFYLVATTYLSRYNSVLTLRRVCGLVVVCWVLVVATALPAAIKCTTSPVTPLHTTTTTPSSSTSSGQTVTQVSATSKTPAPPSTAFVAAETIVSSTSSTYRHPRLIPASRLLMPSSSSILLNNSLTAALFSQNNNLHKSNKNNNSISTITYKSRRLRHQPPRRLVNSLPNIQHSESKQKAVSQIPSSNPANPATTFAVPELTSMPRLNRKISFHLTTILTNNFRFQNGTTNVTNELG